MNKIANIVLSVLWFVCFGVAWMFWVVAIATATIPFVADWPDLDSQRVVVVSLICAGLYYTVGNFFRGLIVPKVPKHEVHSLPKVAIETERALMPVE